ncbi:MAG: tripartite tricarboxylate transporter TctB family protein [Candidatus Binatia bacterium]
MKLKPQIIFDLIVLVFFAFFVWEAKEWKLQARLYPWVIGIPMLLIAAVHLGMELKGKITTSSETAPVDFQFAKGIDPVLARWRTGKIFSCILGFLTAVWLLGFSLSIPLVVFLYLKLEARERWPLTAILTAGAWFIYWGLFEQLLRVPSPEGQIYLWMGL